MTLTLFIADADRLDRDMPAELVLDRRGGLIGRSPSCDWRLPDPRHYISSRHCEVTFRDGVYTLTDVSTNGTILNDAAARMTDPRRIEQGDRFQIGQYQLVAYLTPEMAAARIADDDGWGIAPAATGTTDWGPGANGAAAARSSPSRERPRPRIFSRPPTPAAAPRIPAAPPSPIAVDRPTTQPPLTREAVWDKLAEGNAVDWARGGFGQTVNDDRAEPPAPPPAPPAAVEPRRTEIESVALVAALAAAAGLTRDQIKASDRGVIDRAGALLRYLVSGLVVMVEARARAKSQMGAEATSLSFDGNNPIKFARSPEQALALLLGPRERGFMDAEAAVEDAFFDLQSHQMATLTAMQGALRATLDRFSPGAIRSRAVRRGLLARILPGARDAALWQAYEREFSGVAQGSDEAFMDMFAREFRKAYAASAAQRKR